MWHPEREIPVHPDDAAQLRMALSGGDVFRGREA